MPDLTATIYDHQRANKQLHKNKCILKQLNPEYCTIPELRTYDIRLWQCQQYGCDYLIFNPKNAVQKVYGNVWLKPFHNKPKTSHVYGGVSGYKATQPSVSTRSKTKQSGINMLNLTKNILFEQSTSPKHTWTLERKNRRKEYRRLVGHLFQASMSTVPPLIQARLYHIHAEKNGHQS